MSTSLRYVPEGGGLFEITTRTLHGRYLVRPGDELNEIIVGVLGQAKSLYPVDLVGAVFLSNHYHLLAWVQDAEQMASFMWYFNGNLAREIARLHGWREKIWSRRYRGILVSDEEKAQVARLKYLLSNGAKEHLVPRPQDWPGVHCAEALVSGEPLRGTWFDRTQEYYARLRRDGGARDGGALDARVGEVGREEASVREEVSVSFSPLPCWRHLSESEYRQRVAGLLVEIKEEIAQERRQKNVVMRSRRKCIRSILGQDPHFAPEEPRRSPAPPVHAATGKVRERLLDGWRGFVADFRAAADELRAGNRNARFPVGSFPPGLPFVRAGPVRGP